MFAHSWQQTRGFTLVEILVVVVILGLASALIIPQISSRNDLVAAAAARVTMADLIYAQNRAITTQKPHYIKVAGQQYGVYDTPPIVGATAMTHPINRTPYLVTFQQPGTALANATLGAPVFDGGSSVLGFDEMGSPFSYDVGGGTATPLLNAATLPIISGPVTLTISIEPYTGEATVN